MGVRIRESQLNPTPTSIAPFSSFQLQLLPLPFLSLSLNSLEKSMASRKNYLYFGSSEKINPINPQSQFEFDESEVWGTSNELPHSPKEKKSRSSKKPSKRVGDVKNGSSSASVASSVPVNIPDWSRILGDEYQNHRKESDDDQEMDDGYGGLPPHEYLARTRGSSFSVHEGAGRTLKGRDMSRVRNAVWKQIGFED